MSEQSAPVDLEMRLAAVVWEIEIAMGEDRMPDPAASELEDAVAMVRQAHRRLEQQGIADDVLSDGEEAGYESGLGKCEGCGALLVGLTPDDEHDCDGGGR